MREKPAAGRGEGDISSIVGWIVGRLRNLGRSPTPADALRRDFSLAVARTGKSRPSKSVLGVRSQWKFRIMTPLPYCPALRHRRIPILLCSSRDDFVFPTADPSGER
jgi:hypothetical protein